MYFSEYFSIAHADHYDWFDQILETDTRLFVDPFQIFKEPTESTWSNTHDELIKYFQNAFNILAGHQQNKSSLQYQKTLRLMKFPEPVEFGLGYTRGGRKGSGTGTMIARLTVAAMSDAINLGLQDINHFEELGIIVDNIGKDRISDITCNILKPRFIEYTQQICKNLDVQVEELEVEHSVFEPIRQRWTSGIFRLPRNPHSEDAIILVPKRFLRELPALDANDWWEYVEPELRQDLNLHINDRLKKKDIIARARANTELVWEWSRARESEPASPYPIDRDPEGLHNWQAKTREFALDNPLEIRSVQTSEDLDRFVGEVITVYKHKVEEQGLWSLLYNDDTKLPKKELAIQLLFKGIVESYCEFYSIRLDREVELGRGPVDFVFSRDARTRLLLEVKKASNGTFWNGLDHQLVSYMKSDHCTSGWLLAVQLRDTHAQRKRIRELPERTAQAARRTGFNLSSSWVDARPKKSASKIDSENQGIEDAPVDPEFEDE